MDFVEGIPVRGVVVQLVEHQPVTLEAAGSSPADPANQNQKRFGGRRLKKLAGSRRGFLLQRPAGEPATPRRTGVCHSREMEVESSRPPLNLWIPHGDARLYRTGTRPSRGPPEAVASSVWGPFPLVLGHWASPGVCPLDKVHDQKITDNRPRSTDKESLCLLCVVC